jgi:hypothetical protein
MQQTDAFDFGLWQFSVSHGERNRFDEIMNIG